MFFAFCFFRDERLCFLLFVFLGVRGFVFSRDERQRLCFFAFCFKDEMLCICFF